jgi:hypothetical protein
VPATLTVVRAGRRLEIDVRPRELEAEGPAGSTGR